MYLLGIKGFPHGKGAVVLLCHQACSLQIRVGKGGGKREVFKNGNTLATPPSLEQLRIIHTHCGPGSPAPILGI